MTSVVLEKLLFEREDLEKINAIQQVFREIRSVVLALPPTVAAFKRNGWIAENGQLKTLKVSYVYSEPAFDNLYLSFVPGLNALAQAATSADGEEYFLLFRIPRFKEGLELRTQNLWFIEEVRKWFEKPSSLSLFVHEFIHLLDLARIGDPFADIVLKSTTSEEGYDAIKRKLGRIEARLKVADEKTVEYKLLQKAYNKLYPKWKQAEKLYWTEYLNSPVETNAYFNQAVSTLKSKAETVIEKHGLEAALRFIGTTPQQFVKKVEKQLEKFTNDISFFEPKTMRAFQKRAAVLHSQLVRELTTATQLSSVQNNDVGEEVNATN
jgi:hypothetical protein